MKKNNLPNEPMNMKMGIYLTLPFVLAFPPIIGWFIGNALDKAFDTKPFLMYAFIILGFIAGFKELFRLIQRFKDDI